MWLEVGKINMLSGNLEDGNWKIVEKEINNEL